MRNLFLSLLICLGLAVNAGNESLVIRKDYNLTSYTIKMPLLDRGDSFGRMDGIHPGVVLMLSGASFATAGWLTGRSYQGLGNTVRQGFFEQPGRVAAIITGGVLFTGGLVYTISF